jgi:oligopeptidase A
MLLLLLPMSRAAAVASTDKVLLLLLMISYPDTQKDLADVKAHAAAAGVADELLWWDVAFWAERLREAKYDLKDEELRPYFALPAVLDGLFKVCLYLGGAGGGESSDTEGVLGGGASGWGGERGA